MGALSCQGGCRGGHSLVTRTIHKCTNIELFDDHDGKVLVDKNTVHNLSSSPKSPILADENISLLTMCDVVRRDILAVLASSAHLTIGSSDEKTYTEERGGRADI